MPGEIVAVEQEQVSSLPAPVVTNEQWATRRRDFNEWVNTQLRDNVDFGKVPGTDKPTLLKPGAEKILQLYGCAPEVETVRRDQDIATGYLYVECVARAISIKSGMVVGTGLGACTSFESKYRYRWENWKDKRSSPPADQGWEQASGRYGSYWRRRTENRDLFDVWNTVLKMAKKRAMVDLALTISGASEKFTQDVEDMNGDAAPVAEHEQLATDAKPEPAKPVHWAKDAAKSAEFMSKAADKYGLSFSTILAAMNVPTIEQYPGTMAQAKGDIEAWISENVPAAEPETERLVM